MQNCEKLLLASWCPSVRLHAWNNSAPIGRIFIFDISGFFSTFRRENLKITTGTSHDDLCAFMIVTGWTLLGKKNVSDKRCRENQNTYFMYNVLFFFPENCVGYEIMWNNILTDLVSARTWTPLREYCVWWSQETLISTDRILWGR